TRKRGATGRRGKRPPPGRRGFPSGQMRPGCRGPPGGGGNLPLHKEKPRPGDQSKSPATAAAITCPPRVIVAQTWLMVHISLRTAAAAVPVCGAEHGDAAQGSRLSTGGQVPFTGCVSTVFLHRGHQCQVSLGPAGGRAW